MFVLRLTSVGDATKAKNMIPVRGTDQHEISAGSLEWIAGFVL